MEKAEQGRRGEGIEDSSVVPITVNTHPATSRFSRIPFEEPGA